MELCTSEKELCESDREEGTSATFINLQEVKKITRLKFFEKTENDLENIKISAAESPSMRVRRLLKNDGPKRPKMTTQQMKGKLTQLITNSPQIKQNSFAGSNTLSNYNAVSSVVASVVSAKGEKSSN